MPRAQWVPQTADGFIITKEIYGAIHIFYVKHCYLKGTWLGMTLLYNMKIIVIFISQFNIVKCHFN